MAHGLPGVCCIPRHSYDGAGARVHERLSCKFTIIGAEALILDIKLHHGLSAGPSAAGRGKWMGAAKQAETGPKSTFKQNSMHQSNKQTSTEHSGATSDRSKDVHDMNDYVIVKCDWCELLCQ
jgi:hypothetical protein